VTRKDMSLKAEELAQLFHETYERLAPSYNYETRKESAKPWAEVPEKNKQLMIAVCDAILKQEATDMLLFCPRCGLLLKILSEEAIKKAK
jgi:hypothetical protein